MSIFSICLTSICVRQSADLSPCSLLDEVLKLIERQFFMQTIDVETTELKKKA